MADGNHPLLRAVGLVAVVATTAFVTWHVQRYLDQSEAQLGYAAAAFEAEIDNRYVPVLGITFDRRPIRAYLVQVVNYGSIPQQDVEMSLDEAGEIAQMWWSGTPMPRTRSGELLQDFSRFTGQSEATLLVPSLPPSGFFSCTVLAYRQEDGRLPHVSVQSSSRLGTRLEIDKASLETIRSTLARSMSEWKASELLEIGWTMPGVGVKR